MSSWLWVQEGTTKVDAHAIAAGAVSADQAASQVDRARGSMAPGFGSDAAIAHGSPELWASPLGAYYLALLDEVGPVIAQAQLLSDGVSESIRDFSRWLSQAALIYASAEHGAQGLMSVRTALGSLGPKAVRKPRSVLGYGWAVGNYYLQFKEESTGTLPLGLEAQARMENAAQFLNPKSPDALAQAAAKVAIAWGALGTLFRPESKGVLVMAQNGDSRFAAEPLPPGYAGGRQNPFERLAIAPSLLATRRMLGGLNVNAGLPRAGGTFAGERVTTPLTGGKLLERIEMSEGSGASGQVQVLKHTNVSGAVSWSVVVRGTQEWKPGTTNPQDMQSNLQIVGRGMSDQQRSVETAMEMSGIRPGEPVEMVGHSQGGAVALAIATSARNAGRYNVVSVLTAGAPTGTTPPPRNLSVLNIENLKDGVPALDGAAAPRGKNTVTAYFDAKNLNRKPGDHAHSVDTYTEAMKQMESEKGPLTQPIAKWGERRTEALGIGEGSRTEVLYYDTARVR